MNFFSLNKANTIQNDGNCTEENATPGWNGFSREAMERDDAEPWKAGLVFNKKVPFSTRRVLDLISVQILKKNHFFGSIIVTAPYIQSFFDSLTRNI